MQIKNKSGIVILDNPALADLRGANLRVADLSGADLSEADLSEADLYRANLRGANLRGANLSEADLSVADLSGADLSEANLSVANLSVADLSGANLRGADLSEADLYRADLRGAKGIIKISGLRDDIIAVYGSSNVSIGCQNLSIEEWLRDYEIIGKKARYTPEEIAEYGLRLRFVAERIEAELARSRKGS